MKIVVTGIPGTGKTTVLEKAIAESEKKYAHVNYGNVMFDEAKSKGLVKDRDEMRKLDPKIQKDIQKNAAKKIGKMENVIIDTHASILTPNGYLPGLPEWVLKEIMPNTIVILEASPEEISRRRSKDISRKRDAEDIGGIKEHQEMNRAIAMAYGVITGATIKIIQNHDNGLEEAAKNLSKIL
ncbi:Adenylate kinase [groundwater metagenome]|uniref:Adenylate kinase n=1 Tax=groundwater metagenome TaxID=717931 RepID=A0A098E738_9ZZZZ